MEGARRSIHRAPAHLRQLNPRAFTPQVVIIGPLHYDKRLEASHMMYKECTSVDMENIKLRYKSYLNMEEMKRIYCQSLSKRSGQDVKALLRGFVEENESAIRECYAESTVWISSPEFISLILYDATYIIEFMLRDFFKEVHSEDAPHSGSTYLIFFDLCRFKNQLPFFILQRLYDLVSPMIHGVSGIISFSRICSSAFGCERLGEGGGYQHFADMWRLNKIGSFALHRRPGFIERLYNVEKLYESGVDFEGTSAASSSLNVEFNNGKLQMSPIVIGKEFESDMWNIMGLEQCYTDSDECYVCCYASLLSSLIRTEKDVEILTEKGIIKNHLGQNALVVNMFDKLRQGTATVFSSPYCDVAEAVMNHDVRFWNHTLAALRHNYFNSVWRGTITVAGIIFLVLNVIQTVASVLRLSRD